MSVRSLDEAKAFLYGQPIETFIADRDALVKEVRTGGNRDLANDIKTLRKPSAVAAEVNRVVRADPAGTALILQAAGLLREAQQGALEGSTINASELQEQYRAAVSALAQTASNRKPEVRAALEAATIDVASNDDLAIGALVVVPTPESIFGPSSLSPEVEDEVAKQRAKRQALADEKVAAQDATEAKQEQARLKEQALLKQRKRDRQQQRKQVAKDHRDAVRSHLGQLETEEAAATAIDDADARIVKIDDEIESLEHALAELREERPAAVEHRQAAQQELLDQRERSAEAEAAVTALAEMLDQIDAEDAADV